MTKLKVVVEFSVYNKDYKQPKIKAKLEGLYRGIDDIDDIKDIMDIKDNPLYIKFNVNDVLEVNKIFVCHNSKSYAYITFNNRTYEVPIDVLNFCTEKL